MQHEMRQSTPHVGESVHPTPSAFASSLHGALPFPRALLFLTSNNSCNNQCRGAGLRGSARRAAGRLTSVDIRGAVGRADIRRASAAQPGNWKTRRIGPAGLLGLPKTAVFWGLPFGVAELIDFGLG